MSTDAAATAEHDLPRSELVAGAVGDRCASCNALLAADQRYCVNCGQRRGSARFSYDNLAAKPIAAPAEAAAPPPRGGRFSSGTTLVAGVATLLIAMGVGVLIGHDRSSTPVRASAPSVITVGGGGSAGTAATNGTAPKAASGATKAHRRHAKVKVTKVVVSAKVKKAADAAAAKVLGNNSNLSKNVQQQIGGSCSGGKGCQNGKFTGNFFPGG